MTRRQVKAGYFCIEGLNSFATTLYFYYLFFFMARHFGFGNLENLALAALNGLVYTCVAWFGGRFGQRVGYFRALRTGLIVMVGALTVGARVDAVLGQIIVLAVWSFGLCFTWPNLEALASEGEDALGLQRMV